MKKCLVVLISLSLPLFLKAQEVEKQKEVGIFFSNLDNFGLTFRTGTNKSLWRFSTFSMSGLQSNQDSDEADNKRNNFWIGIGVGKEFRKDIVEKLELRFGADLTFSYSYLKADQENKTDTDSYDHYEQKTYYPGINLVFGLNYKLSDHFIIGAEFLPYFRYEIGEYVSSRSWVNNGDEVKTDTSGFSYGLSNSSVRLSLAYRF